MELVKALLQRHTGWQGDDPVVRSLQNGRGRDTWPTTP